MRFRVAFRNRLAPADIATRGQGGWNDRVGEKLNPASLALFIQTRPHLLTRFEVWNTLAVHGDELPRLPDPTASATSRICFIAIGEQRDPGGKGAPLAVDGRAPQWLLRNFGSCTTE